MALLDRARRWEQLAGDGEHVDPAIVVADRDELQSAAADVKRYVDKHVAHTDWVEVPVDITLTLGDVHDAVHHVGQVYLRYYELLSGLPTTLRPDIPQDWIDVFRVPWIRQERTS